MVSQDAPEPVLLPEVKAWCLVEHSQDDTVLTNLITRVRAAMELKLKISMTAKAVTLTVDLFSHCKLPRGPVVAITTVLYRTGTNSSGQPVNSTLTATDYTTDGELFKTFCSSRSGRHKITYTAGYGADGYALPEELKLALLEEIDFRYNHKGGEDTVHGFSTAAMNLMRNHTQFAWA